MFNPSFVVILFQYNTIFSIVMYFTLVVFTNMCLTVWMRAPQLRPCYIFVPIRFSTVAIFVQTNFAPHIAEVLAFFYSFYDSVLRKCILSEKLSMGSRSSVYLFEGDNV